LLLLLLIPNIIAAQMRALSWPFLIPPLYRDAFRLLHSVYSSESAAIAVFSSLQLNFGFSSWAGADDEKSLCVLCFGRLWVLLRQRYALMVLKKLKGASKYKIKRSLPLVVVPLCAFH
jgi:hypothetical protein